MAETGKRTILVTGASSGIGEATVRRLVAEGATVYAAARRVEAMRPLETVGARVLGLDVTKDDSVRAAVDEIEAVTGGVDVLINNAGYGEYGALEEVPLDRARYQMEVNVLGPARLIQRVLPGMRARRRGRIVNVSSFGGRLAFPLGAWYHASKFALEALSDSLRAEVAPFGIDVVVIQPGAIRTDWARIRYEWLAEASGDGPYAEMAAATERQGMMAHDANGIAVGPEVIADVIARAVRARRPRTRYAAPFHARAFLLLRWVLGDRALDFIMRKQLQSPSLALRPGFRRAQGERGHV